LITAGPRRRDYPTEEEAKGKLRTEPLNIARYLKLQLGSERLPGELTGKSMEKKTGRKKGVETRYPQLQSSI